MLRAFERCTSPVYLVSPDFTVGYANDACARWVGLELELLVSATCVYSSQDLDDVQNRVQGLCPPPELLQEPDSAELAPRSLVVFAIHPDNKKSWRWATMSPLMDADQNNLGVLVICQAQASLVDPRMGGDVSASLIEDAEKLHTALARIRTETDRIYCLESLVGTSSFADRLRRQVKMAIESRADLLIVGPNGSGKEHLSRIIHSARDQNQNSELLPVHCSIADQQLIQQNIIEIVGSQSSSQHSGDIDEQDWLLLLDVDRLGEAAQNELLGFFQLPDFPLRTIATSSVSLIELAEQGMYSADLAYYLSVMTIELVSLARRQSDIPMLAQALIERDNVRRDHQLSGFSHGVLQRFIEFDWPENIDQLNRTIQLAARNTSDSQINESDLPDEFHHALQAMRIGPAAESEIELDQFLGRIERELVVRAVKQAKGNKTKAARLLGISRPKLLRRLHLFEIGGSEEDQTKTNVEELDSSAFQELE